jgi:thioredoxin 1
MPTDIDSEKMEEIQNSDETWVIDFWAEWCGPCKKLAPRFKDVSEELDDVNFGKVDMEEHQQIGTSNGVRALPTLLIMKDGEEVTRKAGAMSKKELKDWIESNV